MFLNGNHLVKFPDTSLKPPLQYLGVARCHLESLPSYLSEFKKLQYLDARDNNISIVRDGLKMLINTNQVESYFSGNAVCETDKSLDCKYG